MCFLLQWCLLQWCLLQWCLLQSVLLHSKSTKAYPSTFPLHFVQSILENKVSINKNSFLGYYGMPSYTASRTNANNLLKYLVNSFTFSNTFQAATYYVISKDSKQIFTETL